MTPTPHNKGFSTDFDKAAARSPNLIAVAML